MPITQPTTEHPLAARYAGMRPVDYDTFYNYMRPRNVVSSPQGAYDQEWGYLSEWTYSGQREVVGVTFGGTTFRKREYRLKS